MYSLIRLVDLAFEIYIWIIIARCVLSFFPHDPRQPIIKFVYDITEPVLRPIQRYVPPVGAIDFSPLVAVFGLMVLQYIVVLLLSSL